MAICEKCNGSGEGRHNGTKCPECKGSGDAWHKERQKQNRTLEECHQEDRAVAMRDEREYY